MHGAARALPHCRRPKAEQGLRNVKPFQHMHPSLSAIIKPRQFRLHALSHKRRALIRQGLHTLRTHNGLPHSAESCPYALAARMGHNGAFIQADAQRHLTELQHLMRGAGSVKG